MATDWNNLDFDLDGDSNLIDPLTVDGLLMQISCNLPEITEETVKAQFETSLRRINQDARAVFEANLKRIVANSTAERKRK